MFIVAALSCAAVLLTHCLALLRNSRLSKAVAPSRAPAALRRLAPVSSFRARTPATPSCAPGPRSRTPRPPSRAPVAVFSPPSRFSLATLSPSTAIVAPSPFLAAPATLQRCLTPPPPPPPFAPSRPYDALLRPSISIPGTRSRIRRPTRPRTPPAAPRALSLPLTPQQRCGWPVRSRIGGLAALHPSMSPRVPS
ncbi:hypothetical protein DENSPDRAFT_851420 [Dentipellis sp. KUC8613]|nr:hypothetical protein DENSPDRAFT_851420 [Dentipellis sp. KUC8613]